MPQTDKKISMEETVAAAEGVIGLALPATADGKIDDAVLFREIQVWENAFADLALTLPDVPPQPHVLDGLRSRIDQAHRVSAPRQQPRTALEHSLLFWRITSAAAAAVLLITLVAFGLTRQTDLALPVQSNSNLMIAQVLPRDGPAIYVVAFDRTRKMLVAVPAAPVSLSAGRSLHLWVTPRDGNDPVPVLALDFNKTTVAELAPDHAQLINADAGLIITIESLAVPNPQAPGELVGHGKLISY